MPNSSTNDGHDVWHMLVGDFKRAKTGTRDQRLALADAWAAYIEQREDELNRLREENEHLTKWLDKWRVLAEDSYPYDSPTLARLHRIEKAARDVLDRTYEGNIPKPARDALCAALEEA